MVAAASLLKLFVLLLKRMQHFSIPKDKQENTLAGFLVSTFYSRKCFLANRNSSFCVEQTTEVKLKLRLSTRRNSRDGGSRCRCTVIRNLVRNSLVHTKFSRNTQQSMCQPCYDQGMVTRKQCAQTIWTWSRTVHDVEMTLEVGWTNSRVYFAWRAHWMFVAWLEACTATRRFES